MTMRILLVAALAVSGISIASAQKDPIAERKATMSGVSDANRTATQLLDGKQPFSVEEARKVFAVMESAGKRMPDLFPDDSKTGGKTRALPAI